MKRSLLGAILVAVFALTGCGQPKDPIVVEDGWVRALPPGAKMTAGYVSITNNGEGELRMLGASSPNFGRIEMHSVYLEDGVQQMRMVDGYKIAPGETLTLEPAPEPGTTSSLAPALAPAGATGERNVAAVVGQ